MVKKSEVACGEDRTAIYHQWITHKLGDFFVEKTPFKKIYIYLFYYYYSFLIKYLSFLFWKNCWFLVTLSGKRDKKIFKYIFKIIHL